jgi:hypothetical protein
MKLVFKKWMLWFFIIPFLPMIGFVGFFVWGIVAVQFFGRTYRLADLPENQVEYSIQLVSTQKETRARAHFTVDANSVGLEMSPEAHLLCRVNQRDCPFHFVKGNNDTYPETGWSTVVFETEPLTVTDGDNVVLGLEGARYPSARFSGTVPRAPRAFEPAPNSSIGAEQPFTLKVQESEPAEMEVYGAKHTVENDWHHFEINPRWLGLNLDAKKPPKKEIEVVVEVYRQREIPRSDGSLRHHNTIRLSRKIAIPYRLNHLGQAAPPNRPRF